MKIKKKTNLLKPKSRKSKSRLMKERRRRQAKRRFLPKPTGDNKFPMTKGCRKVLNKWVKGRGAIAKLFRKISKLDGLLIKKED